VVRAYYAGLEESDHDVLSLALANMAKQARGLRGSLRKAFGRGHRASQAAQALAEAVAFLQETLLEELDRTYGEQAPAVVRTRYSGGL
jgi:hypothetical protein